MGEFKCGKGWLMSILLGTLFKLWAIIVLIYLIFLTPLLLMRMPYSYILLGGGLMGGY